ncbi:MAG: hypothetical protein ACFNL2_10725, partial [Tannerella forsythia]|uniref:hypothetical protein n=1 Tax=Tannerella forsythia TaxID=28112 RepID=UPI00361A14E1
RAQSTNTSHYHFSISTSRRYGRACTRIYFNEAIGIGNREASYLIFRPASVAKACETHEALTFGLLLGQAKSNRKSALNDK